MSLNVFLWVADSLAVVGLVAAKYLPWKLERAVHRVGKVLPERGEQQRAVIAHPKVARAFYKVADALLARLERIGGV